LLVAADDGRVTVRVDAPRGVDTEGWRNRLFACLKAKGIAVDDVHIEEV
jgi:hypothetical protein